MDVLNANVIRRIRLVIGVLSIILLFGMIYACTTKAPLLSNLSPETLVESPEDEHPFEAMDSLDPAVREQGAITLGDISPIKHRYMSSYLKSLKKSEESDRLTAMDNMGGLSAGMAPVIKVLCNGSRDFDARVRLASVKSLGLILSELLQPSEYLEKLKVADPSGSMGQSARRCLENLKAQTVIINATLQVRREDVDRKVRKTAAKILSKNNLEPVQYSVAMESPAPEIKPAESQVPEPESGQEDPVELKTDGDGETIDFPEMDILLKKLESFDLSTRRFALVAIGHLAGKELKDLPIHVTSIKSGDITLRTESVHYIFECVSKMERTVYALEHSMEDVDDDMRISTAQTLAQILKPLALALVPLYNTPREIEDTLNNEKVVPDPMVQVQLNIFTEATQDAIRKIDILLVKGIPVLVRGLDDKNYDVRIASALSLRQTIPQHVLVEDGDTGVPRVWQEFFNTLGENQHDLYVRLLVNDLGNTSVNIARQAAKDLCGMGASAKKAIPALIHVVSDVRNQHVHYKYVQVDAMKALGNMGSVAAQAVPVLIERLKDIRFEIRHGAVMALGQIGGRQATFKVLDLFGHDSSALVQGAALTALASLDPHDCLDEVLLALFNALKDPSGDVRIKAFNALVNYEIKNKATGIIKWKPYAHPVLGYRVCLKNDRGVVESCFETGQVTAFSLGDFNKPVHGLEHVRVEAVQVTGTREMEAVFVDMTSILQKSVAIEKDASVRTEKEKLLLTLLKSLEKNAPGAFKAP